MRIRYAGQVIHYVHRYLHLHTYVCTYVHHVQFIYIVSFCFLAFGACLPWHKY